MYSNVIISFAISDLTLIGYRSKMIHIYIYIYVKYTRYDMLTILYATKRERYSRRDTDRLSYEAAMRVCDHDAVIRL